ncbi:peptidase [Pseudomonas sp. v388]|uniref:PepSY domain-containing protein n=1 Tax=Pseudomonas sp. v388 TaxID=2479849 RepID=UPI000F7A06AE|nr:PepSY domain-containing protein [Pseudomonas sp. v388]RRV04370.1 peptidase [Pseudomonas sp. v388]
MKMFTTLLTAATLAVTANSAVARDIDTSEAQKLQDTGTIQALSKLNEAALATHPGATITDTELENEYGNYVYQVELRDTQGVDWDLELDAVTGQVYKNHQDN